MRITIIATGGTIASTEGGDGLSPTLDVTALLAGPPSDVPMPDAIELTTRQIMAVDSSAIGLREMQMVADAVAAAVDQGADAVVVLHGTDTMEETALLVDLRLPAATVVFTGAMRGADHPEPDGPANIRDAIQAARTAVDEHRTGTRIFFGGRLLPVWGTRKIHTERLHAFEPATPAPSRPELAGPESAGSGRAGSVGEEPPRVDIVALYPGADAVAINALVAAGARGLVLQAMGAGNANPAIVGAVREAVRAGVVVLLTTRVAHGPVYPGYGGGGGGADLVAAGAVQSTWLRAAQARILLAELLSVGATAAEIGAAFTDPEPTAGTA